MMKHLFFVVALFATRTQTATVGILRNSAVTLHYSYGSCKWIITVVESFEIEIGEGPESTITRQTTNLLNNFGWKCVANGTLPLDAAFIVYDTDRIPAPTEITVDVETLRWNHVLHPPLFPPGFQMFINYSITYLVTVRDVESGEEETLIADETTLNLTDVLDVCRRQEFTVQTQVNDTLYSPQSSSYFFHPTSPVFITLSPLLVAQEGKIAVTVLFHLEERQCLTQFHIVIYGHVNISFNVTNSDRERGEVTYDLSTYIPAGGACNASGSGLVFGSNSFGESTSAEIKPLGPEECIMKRDLPLKSTTIETLTLIPTPTRTSSSSSSSSIYIVPVLAVSMLMVVLTIGTSLFFIFITRKKCRGKSSAVTGDVSLQLNEAYCTVTTGVRTKRNEAYETALRSKVDTENKFPVYETVH